MSLFIKLQKYKIISVHFINYQTMKLFLRYLIFVGIPYFLAKRIEKYVWKHASSELKEILNNKLKDLPKLDRVSEHSKDALDIRGGANPILWWVAKVVINDFAIKVAIAGAVGASIWADTADNAAAQLAKYGSAMLSAPGKKFVRLYRRIKGVDPQHSRDIKEILFNNELTNKDKVELLKIKIESALKNLKGSKRKQFILFVIATILFSVGGILLFLHGLWTVYARYLVQILTRIRFKNTLLNPIESSMLHSHKNLQKFYLMK